MKKLTGTLLLAGLALSAGIAFGADGVNSANAPLKEWIDTGNTANKLLCATVGDPGGTGLFGCAKGETALHPIFKVFNLAVMSIAALFMLWNVLSKTMASAQDGEFMGKNASNTWAPLRVTMGWAMLVPAFGGFNLAQLVMVWATAVGVGIAGAAASTSITAMTTVSNIYSVPSNLLKADDLAVPLREKTVCIARWIRETQGLKDAGSLDKEATNVQWGFSVENASINNTQYLVLKYGAKNTEGGYMADDCGTVRVPLPVPSSYNDQGSVAIMTAVGGAMRSQIPRLASVFLEEYDKIARGEVTDDTAAEASRSRLIGAMDEFDAALLMAAKSATSAANAMVTKVSVGKGDWIALGFRDVRAGIANAGTSKGVATKPEGTAAKREAPKDTTTSWGDVYGEKTAMEKLGAMFSAAKDVAVTTGQAMASISGLTDTFNEALNEKVGNLGKTVAGRLKASSAESGGNPLTALITLGTDLSSWAGGVILWFLAVAMGLVLLSFAFPAVGGLITVLGFILSALAVPLMFFGVKLAAYLPFLTAVIWCGAILNWLVIVVEALFGAPLWAMVHLDMDGDGLNMQRTGHGYIFLLNLMFRPAMMVGAFIFAQLAMSAVFGLFIGAVGGILDNLTASSADWWGNLLMVIGAVWVVVMFAEQIATQALGLIFQIPDKVFAWIGGQFGSNVGADLERNVGNKADQGFGAAGGAGREAAQVVSKGAGDAINYIRDRKGGRPIGGNTVSTPKTTSRK